MVSNVDYDVAELIQKLNEALAEEWLAYYQYWIGSKIMEGPLKGEIEPDLLRLANQEIHHASLIVGRILHLGGVPLLDPKEWFNNSKCPYEAPTDPSIEIILEQSLRREHCAVERFEELAKLTEGKDHSTHQMATFILKEEREHEAGIEKEMKKFKMYSKEFPLGT